MLLPLGVNCIYLYLYIHLSICIYCFGVYLCSSHEDPTTGCKKKFHRRSLDFQSFTQWRVSPQQRETCCMSWAEPPSRVSHWITGLVSAFQYDNSLLAFCPFWFPSYLLQTETVRYRHYTIHHIQIYFRFRYLSLSIHLFE